MTPGIESQIEHQMENGMETRSNYMVLHRIIIRICGVGVFSLFRLGFPRNRNSKGGHRGPCGSFV